MSRLIIVKRSGSLLLLGFPTALRLLFVGDLVTAVGIGLTQPYLVVLLHTVKGVPLVAATVMTSLLALASFPGNWLAGAVADRLGGHRTMGIGLTVAASGLVFIAAGHGRLTLGLGIAAVGFGWSVTLPAYATLIAKLVPASGHTRAFTIQYALLNVGIAAGAAGGALVVHRSVNESLAVLWWVAAATCVLAAGAVWLSHAAAHQPMTAATSTPLAWRVRRRAATQSRRRPGGYRLVVIDRALLPVLLAAVLASAAGYGVYNAGLPVLAILAGDPAIMSWVSVANCLTVVLGLPVALGLVRVMRPPQLLAVTAALWSTGWLLCLTQAHAAVLDVRITLPLAGALIGAGELFLAGALPAMVNALAPEALRGRYNAMLTLSITAGMGAGPMLTAAATALGSISSLFATAVALLAAVTILVPRLSQNPAVPATLETT
jgi:MFS family permease